MSSNNIALSNVATKKPIQADRAATVQEIAYQNGAMVRVSGPNLILSPPLVLTENDTNILLSAIDTGLAAAT